jgi:hypothetical protein
VSFHLFRFPSLIPLTNLTDFVTVIDLGIGTETEAPYDTWPIGPEIDVESEMPDDCTHEFRVERCSEDLLKRAKEAATSEFSQCLIDTIDFDFCKPKFE